MPKSPSTEKSLAAHVMKRVAPLADSRLVGWFVNLPPVAWVLRVISRTVVERRIRGTRAAGSPVEQVTRVGLEATLQQIVDDVVSVLGYTGAMVATYEQDGSLPVRAFYVDPDRATEEQVHRWEEEASEIFGHPLSISDPDIAMVFLHQDEYKDNLSVRAYKAGGPIMTDELYDLCTPIAPPVSRPFIKGIQEALGIQELIAVPFFIETLVDGRPTREIVGNLFAAKQSEISERDKRTLTAFGRQAAATIESERRHFQVQVAQRIVFEVQSSIQDEVHILERIAAWVVSDLSYAGVVVATYERDGSLPVRAFYVDPDLATEEQVRRWEEEVSEIVGRPLSISDPDIARVFLHQDEYKDNLSVRAYKAGGPVMTDELYDLCTPIAPPASRPFIKGIQEALGIQKLIAVPFFIETLVDGQPTREIVGNLFAATRSRAFSSGQIELLKMFGQQAAAGIRNARLYRRSEELRQIAQTFGKMAFSASAYVHDLRNHIGAFRGHFQLLQLMDELSAEDRQEILALNASITARLDKAAEILDSLHEPWRYVPDQPTDINACLARALRKVVPDRDAIRTTEGIEVTSDLFAGLPLVITSSAMLTEAFKVLIKNAVEAIREKGRGGNSQRGELRVESRLGEADDQIVEILVCDSGTGIRPEHLSKVFEMRWSTKGGKGMGFGLFWTKDYIEGLGGSIEVESVWEKGTTFHVRLPAAHKESDGSRS